MTKAADLRITPKDLQVLLFLWKWKVSSTAAICVRFAHNSATHPGTTYHRLCRLQTLGFVERIPTFNRRGNLWTLTKAGFDSILGNLPELSEKGFASEAVRHDHICQAAHLCLWLPGDQRTDDCLYSEQELRRVHANCIPEWVPNVRWHRPDGYWRLRKSSGHRIVALEVELNAKSNDAYENISLFYNESQSIDSVLWIVDGSTLGKKVLSQWKKCGPRKRGIYNFVYLKDFMSVGADAKVIDGSHASQTMSAFLTDGQSSPDHPATLPSPSQNYVRFLFDTAVKRTKSIPSTFTRNSPNSLIACPAPLHANFSHQPTTKENNRETTL